MVQIWSTSGNNIGDGSRKTEKVFSTFGSDTDLYKRYRIKIGDWLKNKRQVETYLKSFHSRPPHPL